MYCDLTYLLMDLLLFNRVQQVVSVLGRLNQDTGRFLCSYCAKNQQDWGRFLPWLEYAVPLLHRPFSVSSVPFLFSSRMPFAPHQPLMVWLLGSLSETTIEVKSSDHWTFKVLKSEASIDKLELPPNYCIEQTSSPVQTISCHITRRHPLSYFEYSTFDFSQ